MAPTPGDALLSKLSLAALAVWLLNDHVLQPYWPGLISGKLGDVASLVLLPVALQAVIELFGRGASFRPSARLSASCCVAIGAFFVAMETTELGSWMFRFSVGLLQWPFSVLRAGQLTAVRLVAHVADVEDLLTLPALLLPYYFGERRASVAREAAAQHACPLMRDQRA